MLAPVLRFNAEAAASHYSELAAVVGAGGQGDATARTAAFIAFLEDLMDRSGAPRRLRDVGVTQSSLPTLAADAMKQQRLLLNNPVVVTESDALRLYEQAY
jgi:alcohol dehydrogenase class IV